MVGIDTNVLARLLTRDDAAQTRRAEALVRKECGPDKPGRISVIVICELVWVLQGAYGYGRPDIAKAFETLLKAPMFQVEDELLVAKALKVWKSANLDFSDALIAERNLRDGCATTFTFDRKAAKRDGFSPVP